MDIGTLSRRTALSGRGSDSTHGFTRRFAGNLTESGTGVYGLRMENPQVTRRTAPSLLIARRRKSPQFDWEPPRCAGFSRQHDDDGCFVTAAIHCSKPIPGQLGRQDLRGVFVNIPDSELSEGKVKTIVGGSGIQGNRLSRRRPWPERLGYCSPLAPPTYRSRKRKSSMRRLWRWGITGASRLDDVRARQGFGGLLGIEATIWSGPMR